MGFQMKRNHCGQVEIKRKKQNEQADVAENILLRFLRNENGDLSKYAFNMVVGG